MTVTKDDFEKIWASSSPLTPYSFSDSQYKEGWNFIGSTPPSRQMWDFLQKNNDEKMQYLADNYLPLSGGTMTGKLQSDAGAVPIELLTTGTDYRDIQTFSRDGNHRIGLIRMEKDSSNHCKITIGASNTSNDAPSGITIARGPSGNSVITGITPPAGDNSTKLATTAFVTATAKAAISYYNSVDEMRNSETAIVGRPCVTLGYYAPNDGGGAVYIVRSKKESDVDDGGSILVLDNGNVAELLVDGEVNVKQFGAKGDGTADDTTAIKAAFAFAKSKITGYHHASSNYKDFQLKVYFPTGIYCVSDTIDIGGLRGLYVAGEGYFSSVVLFTNSAKTLFNAALYAYHTFEDISFVCGTYSTKIDYFNTKNSICFDWNGHNGGTYATFIRCSFEGWGIVERTHNPNNDNDDNHHHYLCIYQYNSIIWDNNMSQSVIWTYDTCKAYHNDVCFKNPTGQLRILGGDYINPGSFLLQTQNPYGGEIIKVTNARFESYQNIDPTSSPKLVDIQVPTSGWKVIFDCCEMAGGGRISDLKPLFKIQGVASVKFEKCTFPDRIEITCNGTRNEYTATVTWKDCYNAPNINVITQPGQAWGLPTINIENDGTRNSYRERYYGGRGFWATKFLGGKDSFSIDNTITPAGKSYSFPCQVLYPYILIPKEFEIGLKSNQSGTYTVTVYADSTKATTIYSTTLTISADGGYAYAKSDTADIQNMVEKSWNSEDLYVEITHNRAYDLFCEVNISVTYDQVGNRFIAQRKNSFAYPLGAVIYVSSHGYRAIVAGTTAGTAPTMPTTVGQTVTDNTVTWECIS